MGKKIQLLTLILLIAFCRTMAQSGRLISADNELSNSLIYQVYQDKRDIIWIATEDGLNRYDGAKFTIYKHSQNDPFSLGHNFARTLFEDSKGHFFVGLCKGLQLYDYATDSFCHIPIITHQHDTIRPHITSIIERKNGDILIGTSGEGIYRINDQNSRLEARQINEIVPGLFIVLLYEDKEDNLWVSTQDKGLYQYTTDKKLVSFFRLNNLVLHNISSICEDVHGNLLVGSMNKGVYSFNRQDVSFYPVSYPEDPSLPVKTLYTDSISGNVYIGTDGKGIKIYNPETCQIKESQLDVAVFDLDKSKVHTFMKDKDGNIWMGLYQKGVLFLPTQHYKFNYIGYKSVIRNNIGSNCVLSLLEDHEGILWIGTDNDGLYGIAPDGKQYAHFTPSGKSTGIPGTIMSIYEDSNNNLWVGSYLQGIAKVNKKTGRCQYLSTLIGEGEKPVERIFAITEDRTGRLWIGTMGDGLFSLDIHTGIITNHNIKVLTADILTNYWIDCLMIASDNKLYIGTYDGLVCLDLETNSYLTAFGIPKLFTGLIVYALYEDKEGNIWVGTSEGLKHINKRNGNITSYTMADGLASNVICAVKGDENKNLWISTHYGISKFDIQTSLFINYYASDGLQGNEFGKNAAIINSRGQMVFGGINGITYFNPDEITFQTKKMGVRITDFYIHDKTIKKGTKSGAYTIIDTSVLEADNFRLSHADNSFSIEFSVMNFSNPERVTYIYQINNGNWVTLRPGINRISFSNLAPGKYHFTFKARDYNSYSDEKKISVTIYPPWYLTLWAKMVYVLIFLFVVYLVIKMLKHKQAEEINEAKLQFFMNIAHEIRTPMSLVISPLKRLMTSDKDKERQKNYITIHKNTERILNLINQLMDIRKIDKGIMVLKFQEVEIVNFIKELYNYYDYHAKTKNITFNLHTGINTLPVWVDPGHFDKIILNVLSNAFKYTPEKGKVDIYLNITEKENEYHRTTRYLEIIISDNGIGIQEEDKNRIFERFYQIRNSHNNPNISTGIGLHLTLSLVKLHHGIIWAENNPEGGARFIIHIPLGCEHLQPGEMEDNPELIKTYPAEKKEIQEGIDAGAGKIKSKSRKRIIVVEDDEDIRKYICNELARDYHMQEYSNGKEAWTAILKKAPDLVISDIMMPQMDGITLCRKIRQNINTNHVPVVLVTARSGEEDNLEGLSTGADAYIVKPFNIDLVKKTIENIIRTREILRNTYTGNQQQEDKVDKIQIKSADEKLIEKVMKIINDNISNPGLSVEMIAEQVGLSRVHLHRKLKELTNQTTRDLIRNVRLKQAADLLAHKNLTISEVSDATGFSNLAYFSNAFKALYGVSPTTWVEEQKK